MITKKHKSKLIYNGFICRGGPNEQRTTYLFQLGCIIKKTLAQVHYTKIPTHQYVLKLCTYAQHDFSLGG